MMKRQIRTLVVMGAMGVALMGGSAAVFAATPKPPPASIIGAGQGQPITLVAQQPTGNPVRYVWSFGDGSFDEAGASVSHTFDVPGSSSVSVDIVDANGSDSFQSFTVIVSDTDQSTSAADQRTADTYPVGDAPFVP